MTESPAEAQAPTPLSCAEFLAMSPPAVQVALTDPLKKTRYNSLCVTPPLVELHCEHPSCSGTRFFATNSSSWDIERAWGHHFVVYTCKNCESTQKSYSLLLRLSKEGTPEIVKMGEWPPFGPRTPSKLIRILGPEKDLFMRGRRAECHGLGIGAFTYYRRVVENQKNQLFDEIIKVVKKVDDSPEIVEDLTKAKDTFHFTNAMKDVKLAIPQVLLVDGHNPLLLLHSALSVGIHDKTDEECLDLARNIRIVLGDLAERLGRALSDHNELKDAVSKLLQVNAEKGKKKSQQEVEQVSSESAPSASSDEPST